MSLIDQINADLKTAMLAKDKLRMETLRSLKTVLKIDANESALNTEEEINRISNAAKKRRDAAELFSKAGRQDLADKENSELVIISEYLPKQLSDEEITTIITKSIAELKLNSPKDIGQLMGHIMPQVKGKADGKKIQTIARTLLS